MVLGVWFGFRRIVWLWAYGFGGMVLGVWFWAYDFGRIVWLWAYGFWAYDFGRMVLGVWFGFRHMVSL